MFILIPPHEFYKKSRDAVEDKINEKYSNKKVGLCICMWDLLKVSDGLIGHGTGNANINVEFRMIVFRPFKGEIITGKVLKSSAEGIKISTEFFDDITVYPNLLFTGTVYDQNEGVWAWKSDVNPVWFDEGTIVRFRVEDEIWHDIAPRGDAAGGAAGRGSGMVATTAAAVASAGATATVAANATAESEQQQREEAEARELARVPYAIVGAMDVEGLGGIDWW